MAVKRSYPFRKRRSIKRRKMNLRRVNIRRGRRYYRKARLLRAPSNYGFPPNKLVRCTYWFNQLGTFSADNLLNGFGTNCVMRMDSPYDPNYGSTGTFNLSSAGYKLYASLYNQYIVLGAKAVYTLRQTSTTVNTPIRWGVKLDEDALINGFITNGTWVGIASDPNTRSKNFQFKADGSAVSTVVIKYSPRRFHGINNPKDNKHSIGAAVGNNPTDTTFAVPWYQSINCSTALSATTYSLSIKLTQLVNFSDLKDISLLNSANALMES